jgi:DNA-binding transcriptional MerR regulator
MEEEVVQKKLYYSISEVAEMFKENQSTLRFWEKEFEFLKPRTNKKGTRFYSNENIEDLRTIYHLLREKGLTINGAKEQLKSSKKDDLKRNSEIVDRLKKIKQELLDIKKELGEN